MAFDIVVAPANIFYTEYKFSSFFYSVAIDQIACVYYTFASVPLIPGSEIP